jgi:hypothetical protein
MNYSDEIPELGRVATELDGRIVGGGLTVALDNGAATVSMATAAPKIKVQTKRKEAETLQAKLAAKAAQLEPMLRELSPIELPDVSSLRPASGLRIRSSYRCWLKAI